MADPTSITGRARTLRRDMTEVERWLWHRLRDRRLAGRKFLRQMPVGPFFADFACREAKLIVELDGSQHADSPIDARRDAYLTLQGFSVLRFWNHEVATDIGAVCETIVTAVEGRLAPYDRFKVP